MCAPGTKLAVQASGERSPDTHPLVYTGFTAAVTAEKHAVNRAGTIGFPYG